MTRQRTASNAMERKGDHSFKNIVVALDGSQEGEEIMPYVEPIARAFGSKITFVRALVPLEATVLGEMELNEISLAPGTAQSIIETQELRSEEDASYLAAVKKRWAARGFDVECREPQMRPAEAIVEIARETRAHLIAMATHGRIGIRRTVEGSVADEVVRSAPCAVLVIKPSDAGSAQSE